MLWWAPRVGERVVHFLDHRGRAAEYLRSLFRRRRGLARPGSEAVVAADDVQRGEADVGAFPADVLRNALRGLARHGRSVLAERAAGLGEEHLANLGEAFERVVAAVVRPVAVGPLVVADGVDERVAELVEVGLDHLEVLVAAHARAVLDVAEVVDPLHRGVGVDLGDDVREIGNLRAAVRDISDDGERVAVIGGSRCGCRLGRRDDQRADRRRGQGATMPSPHDGAPCSPATGSTS